MKIVKVMERRNAERTEFKEIPLAVSEILDGKLYKKYSFWLYWQHKNGMFYLKKIWKLKSYLEEVWLFWKLGHYVVKLDSPYKWWLHNFFVCCFDIPYSIKVKELIPNEINPLHLKKWRRMRKKVNENEMKQVPLF